MSEISRFLPGKRYLAMSQAAATPNTVLSGTTMAAVSRVSLMAAQVSSCAQPAEVGGHALLEGLGEDRGQRQHHHQGQEQQASGDQQERT